MLEIGAHVERYTVEALLGQGGMGAVYRVRHSTLGTVHALKVLTLDHPQMRARTLQEGRLQAGLRHPNIVAVTDVLDHRGQPALLMDFVDGPTLEDWLDEHQPTTEQALALFEAVVAGVARAHAHGLVHRDLKPANILLETKGGRLVPRVTDFGLAKATASEGEGLTKTGLTMGTPAYMAPEQVANAKGVDQRADIFALGCILYELMSGQRAHRGESLLALLTAVSEASYPPLRDVSPTLPEGIYGAVDRAMALDPDARTPSCEALLLDLSGRPRAVREQAGEPPEPPPSPQPSLTIDALREPHVAWSTALVAAGVGVSALGAFVVFTVLGWAHFVDGPPVLSTPDGSCEGGSSTQVIGYAKTSRLFFKDVGDTWRIKRSIAVVYPKPGDGLSQTVCTLRPGDAVQLLHPRESIEGKGHYMPIAGGAVSAEGRPE